MRMKLYITQHARFGVQPGGHALLLFLIGLQHRFDKGKPQKVTERHHVLARVAHQGFKLQPLLALGRHIL